MEMLGLDLVEVQRFFYGGQSGLGALGMGGGRGFGRPCGVMAAMRRRSPLARVRPGSPASVARYVHVLDETGESGDLRGHVCGWHG